MDHSYLKNEENPTNIWMHHKEGMEHYDGQQASAHTD